ncbi:hypothetical protein EVAR_83629_1 [Eumeta japonica]|uniref:Uncharacterized protein n=1 Tax=Eumeta variegata TaxID=151549 RepID=A0A4C1UNF6_EUMVA|nr:hypothetical protein EVAR_83629_1 [Eumeta japonica]
MEQTYTQHSMRLTIHQIMQKNGEKTATSRRRRSYYKRVSTTLLHNTDKNRNERYNKAVYSVPNKESVPASPPRGPPLEQVGTSPTPVHLHGDRLLRAANSENRSNYE